MMQQLTPPPAYDDDDIDQYLPSDADYSDYLAETDEDQEPEIVETVPDVVSEETPDVVPETQYSLEALARFDFDDSSTDDETPEETLDPLPPVDLESVDAEDIEITVQPRKFHKRPGVKLIAAGLGSLVVFMVIGQMFAGAGNVDVFAESEDTPTEADSQLEEENSPQNELASAQTEVATSRLDREVATMKKNSKNNKKKGQGKDNSPDGELSQSSAGRSVRIPSNPSHSSFQPIRTPQSSAPSSRISFPSRQTTPSFTAPARTQARSSSQNIAPNRVAQIPRSLASFNEKQGTPLERNQMLDAQKPSTMLSLGSVPNSILKSIPKSVPSSIPKSALSDTSLNPLSTGEIKTFSDSEALLSQELNAFMGGATAKKISVGQSFLGETKTNAIAVNDSQFLVQIMGGNLDGAIVIGKVDAVTGSNLTATAQTMVINDRQYQLENVAITAKGGKALKAKRNRGFFNSSFGKALLGAGKGLASQATSKAESFTQFEGGGFSSSKEGGSKDFQSLAFGALNGFTDPLLEASAPDETAFLKQGSQIEIHFYKGITIYE